MNSTKPSTPSAPPGVLPTNSCPTLSNTTATAATVAVAPTSSTEALLKHRRNRLANASASANSTDINASSSDTTTDTTTPATSAVQLRVDLVADLPSALAVKHHSHRRSLPIRTRDSSPSMPSAERSDLALPSSATGHPSLPPATTSPRLSSSSTTTTATATPMSPASAYAAAYASSQSNLTSTSTFSAYSSLADAEWSASRASLLNPEPLKACRAAHARVQQRQHARRAAAASSASLVPRSAEKERVSVAMMAEPHSGGWAHSVAHLPPSAGYDDGLDVPGSLGHGLGDGVEANGLGLEGRAQAKEPTLVKLHKKVWRNKEPKVVRWVHNTLMRPFGEKYVLPANAAKH